MPNRSDYGLRSIWLVSFDPILIVKPFQWVGSLTYTFLKRD
jgi:hypothetical protein